MSRCTLRVLLGGTSQPNWLPKMSIWLSWSLCTWPRRSAVHIGARISLRGSRVRRMNGSQDHRQSWYQLEIQGRALLLPADPSSKSRLALSNPSSPRSWSDLQHWSVHHLSRWGIFRIRSDRTTANFVWLCLPKIGWDVQWDVQWDVWYWYWTLILAIDIEHS